MNKDLGGAADTNGSMDIRLPAARDSKAQYPALPQLNALLIPLVFICILALNLFLLPQEPAVGLDFLLFYGTALAARHGYSPYDSSHRGQILKQLPLISRPHQHMVAGLYGNPPLFAWALEPLTHLSPLSAYAVWVAILFAATLSGGCALLYAWSGARACRWPALFLVLCALSPASMYAYFMGQLAPILLLGVALAVAALRRMERSSRLAESWAVLAGISLTVVWLKPHLLLPTVVALALLLPRRTAAALVGGFIGGSGLCACWSIAMFGRAIFLSWARGLVTFGQSFGAQPGISSLAGLYQPALGPLWSTAVSGFLVILWLFFAGWLILCARRRRLTTRDDDWLRVLALTLVSWLLVVPYTHTPDLPLIALALPALLGQRMERWAETRVRVAVVVFLIAPELDLAGGFALSATMAYGVLVPIAFLVALRPMDFLRPTPAAHRSQAYVRHGLDQEQQRER